MTKITIVGLVFFLYLTNSRLLYSNDPFKSYSERIEDLGKNLLESSEELEKNLNSLAVSLEALKNALEITAKFRHSSLACQCDLDEICPKCLDRILNPEEVVKK